jgi:hypothetical protein
LIAASVPFGKTKQSRHFLIPIGNWRPIRQRESFRSTAAHIVAKINTKDFVWAMGGVAITTEKFVRFH